MLAAPVNFALAAVTPRLANDVVFEPPTVFTPPTEKAPFAPALTVTPNPVPNVAPSDDRLMPPVPVPLTVNATLLLMNVLP